MSDSEAISRAWKRVDETGKEMLATTDHQARDDRLRRLAIALGMLRDEIRKSPEAESELQRRLRSIEQQAGPETELHRLISRLVAALDEESSLKFFEQRESNILRGSATFASVKTPSQLDEIRKALRLLAHRLDVYEEFERAQNLVNNLIEVGIREEIEAANALDLLAEEELHVRVDEITADTNRVLLFLTVPLDDVGTLVEQLLNLPANTNHLDGSSWSTEENVAIQEKIEAANVLALCEKEVFDVQSDEIGVNTDPIIPFLTVPLGGVGSRQEQLETLPADTKQSDGSSESGEPSPAVGHDYLGIELDIDKRIIRRVGCDIPVNLSNSPASWELFLALYAKRGGKLRPNERRNLKSEETGHKRLAERLRETLLPVRLTVRDFMLLDDGHMEVTQK